jgi:hypothetical protein
MTLVRLVSREGVQGHLTLCEPGQCPACDNGWEALRADARKGNTFREAFDLKSWIKQHISGHPSCTLDDLKRRLGCSEGVLSVCIHLLVHDFQLSGPNPYACGYYEAATYRVLQLPGPPRPLSGRRLRPSLFGRGRSSPAPALPGQVAPAGWLRPPGFGPAGDIRRRPSARRPRYPGSGPGERFR